MSLDYSHYQDVLQQAGFPGSAADVHGALCGMLSAGGAALAQLWLEDTLSDCEAGDVQPGILNADLVDLGLATWQALSGHELGFTPLLPSDDANLDLRTEALAAWCQGFLFGLARSGLAENQLKEGLIGEVLGDFVEISKATGEGDQDPVAGGFALEELVEHVRVSAQLVFEELLPTREALLHRH